MKSTNANEFLIGTRGSLLAVTQATLLKNEIERLSQVKLDLKLIKTQGDQITDKPLWQLEGKDFFTKELDAHLLENKVDLVIHSYKDLGSDRPEGIKIGAITERKYPHDILLIKNKTISTLKDKSEIIIGTSSPRRIVNIESSLASYIAPHANVKCKMLRGNVNTRIEKLLDDQYDAIILAFAGLERLAAKEDSAEILKDLMKDLNFMILPVKTFPPASSQGALAVEYNESRKEEILPMLEKVHCEKTAKAVSIERKNFQKYGGGCHLAVGIHTKAVQDKLISIEIGEVDEKPIHTKTIEGQDYSDLKGKSVYHMIGEADFLIERNPIENPSSNNSHLFVTSSYCFNNINEYKTLWAAGNQTMKKMFANGLWVNGSSESFGHGEIHNFIDSHLINLLHPKTELEVLTHKDAELTRGELTASYEHITLSEVDAVKESNLLASDAIYWSSAIQFKTYTEKYPELKNKIHITGLGKTYSELKEFSVYPVIDLDHLKAIL